MSILPRAVKPELHKGAQWRKVASRGDGTSTAELVCQAEGLPRVQFSWAKNGLPMDFANPRSGGELLPFDLNVFSCDHLLLILVLRFVMLSGMLFFSFLPFHH